MENLIVVLGITGSQGGSVADVFLQEPGWKIRGVTRDLTKKSSVSWQDKGVEMVEADLDHPESLARAFDGATAIFAVTDHWEPMYNKYTYGKLRRGQTINEYCYELEVKRGANIAQAASNVATLIRFIFSSLPNIKAITQGKFAHVYHFDAKAAIMEHIKTTHPELHAKVSEVQLAEFATNWEIWRLRRPVKESDGSYSFLVPGNPQVPFALVVAHKDTGYFVRALVLLPPGKTLLGYSSLFNNHDEYLQTWTSIMGVPKGEVKQISVEEAAAFEGGPHGVPLAETMAVVMELDLSNPALMHPHQIPAEIGCPTTSVVDYMKSVDYSPMLNLE